VHTVAIGSHDRVVVTVREVFKAAILHNADRVVVAHNHPSGPVTPSKEDNRLTRDLVRASKLLGIEIADHVIVGRGAFWSFRDHGQL
jgi:DNA repair protein RadC